MFEITIPYSKKTNLGERMVRLANYAVHLLVSMRFIGYMEVVHVNLRCILVGNILVERCRAITPVGSRHVSNATSMWCMFDVATPVNQDLSD